MEKEFVQQITDHEKMMHHVCNTYARTLNRDDLTQDILYNAWKAFKRKETSTFTKWFYIICRNVCISALRKEMSEPLMIPITDEADESVYQQDKELEAKIKQGERYDTVISNLSDDEKEIIFLYIDGLSYKDMAIKTGLNENHLRVKINRIKKRLHLRYGR